MTRQPILRDNRLFDKAAESVWGYDNFSLEDLVATGGAATGYLWGYDNTEKQFDLYFGCSHRPFMGLRQLDNEEAEAEEGAANHRLWGYDKHFLNGDLLSR